MKDKEIITLLAFQQNRQENDDYLEDMLAY